MFDIWMVPMAISIAIMGFIGIVSVVKKPAYDPEGTLTRQDRSVAEPIENHPFLLNPILWVIFIASFFTFIVIMYYWASF